MFNFDTLIVKTDLLVLSCFYPIVSSIELKDVSRDKTQVATANGYVNHICFWYLFYNQQLIFYFHIASFVIAGNSGEIVGQEDSGRDTGVGKVSFNGLLLRYTSSYLF